jgi:cell shape-determining protein MreC
MNKQNEPKDKEIIEYFKGKDINKADKLLIKTAQNNFNKGFIIGSKIEKEKFDEFIKELKDILENKKYEDDEYSAHQSFLKGQCSQIIDKLAGEKLK